MLGKLVLCSAALLASLVATTSARPQDPLKAIAPIPQVRFTRPPVIRAPATLRPTRKFHQMKSTKHKGGPAARSVAAILGAHQRAIDQPGGYQNITPTNSWSVAYSLEVTIANTTTELIMDTGSADTWVIHDNFNCTDWTGQSVDLDTCAFGPTYSDDFQYGLADEDAEVHLYISYGDGEIVQGPMGYSDITIGGITVEKQQFALANQTFWYGDNVTSGMLGLAYPALVNSYYGEPEDRASYLKAPYPPIFTNMVDQGLSDPFFSIAISRNSTGGVIGFGGVPEVEGLDYSTVGETDLIIANLINDAYTASDYSFYTIIPDGIVYGSSLDRGKYPYIVDSGTTLIYLPPKLADAVNDRFDPPAKYIWMYGGYFTDCNADAPEFAVGIGGSIFRVNPRDMIYRDMRDPMSGLCMTSIASGGIGPYVLGAAFMQNVVAVFDHQAAQMRFMGRPSY